MSMASAIVSWRSTSSDTRMPPLVGSLWCECCARYAYTHSTSPSSRKTGNVNLKTVLQSRMLLITACGKSLIADASSK